MLTIRWQTLSDSIPSRSVQWFQVGIFKTRIRCECIYSVIVPREGNSVHVFGQRFARKMCPLAEKNDHNQLTCDRVSRGMSPAKYGKPKSLIPIP